MSNRLLSRLEVAKKIVISVGTGIKNAYGWPRRHGRRTAISVLPTSWGAIRSIRIAKQKRAKGSGAKTRKEP